MNEIRVRAVLVAVMVGAPMMGCAKTRPPIASSQPATAPVAEDGSPAQARVAELRRLSEEYASLAHDLPGRTPDAHRELMAKVFGELEQILPLLADPSSSSGLPQRLSRIRSTQSELQSGAPEPTVEPTIDNGLRAAYSALYGVSRGKSYDAASVDPLLDAMLAKVSELDLVHGLTHQVIAGEVVDSSGAVIAKMTDLLAQQIAPEPATQPSTEPATQPAAPSTAASEAAPASQPK